MAVKPIIVSGSGHSSSGAIDRALGDADRLALVKRPPPQHRIMDDRQVDRADQPEQRRHPPLPAPLALGRGQGDVAEIEEEQDQHRGQPAVPFPPGAPGRPAPDRAGRQAQRGKGRARRSHCPAGNGCKRMAPDQLADRCGGDRRPAGHAEPGGGNVDVEDADGFALQIIGRSDRQPADKPAARSNSADAQQPRRGRAGNLQEAGGIGVTVHGWRLGHSRHCERSDAIQRHIASLRSAVARSASAPSRPQPRQGRGRWRRFPPRSARAGPGSPRSASAPVPARRRRHIRSRR